MKAALIVGINYYEHGNPLYGCVNDAYNVKSVLERNGDGSVNFDCKLLTASGPRESIDRMSLMDSLIQLFSIKSETVLFYFAGHGHVEVTGGYLLASDSKRGNEGISLGSILTLARESPAANKIIILDSCHSGIAGESPGKENESSLTEGLTILTSSSKEQYSSEEDGSGVFTSLLVDGLSGGAANLLGEITPGSVYAHIDQSLGAFDQRPIFKTNVRTFISLRKVAPAISLEDLRRILDFFPTPGFEFRLDPSYEPEMKGRDEGMPLPVDTNNKVFAVLQKFNRLNLVVPDAPHMWNAAMESKTCKLTALGEHYRRLVKKVRI
jgi:hypothetical protein